MSEANDGSLGTSVNSRCILLRRVVGHPRSCRAPVSVGVVDFEFTPLPTVDSHEENGFILWVMTAATQKSIGSSLSTVSHSVSSSFSGVCTNW